MKTVIASLRLTVVEALGQRRKRYQCDYRHTDGELFSCVAPTLTECHRKRDEWLNKRATNN
ncbi:MAG: DUF3873 domain-containing protein [Muribaculaceae bacterium]|nr:DUF3873 domain-containing protein [Muribaculaceae bacterium]